MTKGEKLQDIIKYCERRFNRSDTSTWKHGDFVDLHSEILRDTNTNISPSTLKRIFGKVAVDGGYIPQQATLDALKNMDNISSVKTQNHRLPLQLHQTYPTIPINLNAGRL